MCVCFIVECIAEFDLDLLERGDIAIMHDAMNSEYKRVVINMGNGCSCSVGDMCKDNIRRSVRAD